MTVGMAAAAGGAKVAVFLTDKQLTNPRTGLWIEDEGSKAFSLDNGWQILYAGDPTTSREVMIRLGDLAGQPLRLEDMAREVWKAYAGTRDWAKEEFVLKPHLLTKELYAARPATLLPLPAELLRVVGREVEQFDFSCHLLAIGFDNEENVAMFKVSEDGIEVEQKFAAIGIGADVAEAHLAWRQTSPGNSVARVLFEVCEAKFHTKQVESVGESFDAYLYAAPMRQPKKVDREIVELIRLTFEYHDQSPFKRKRSDAKHHEPPPDDWEEVITNYCDEAVKTKVLTIQNAATKPAASNASGPPSLQSRIAVQRRASRPAPSRPSIPRDGQAPRRRGPSRRSLGPRSEKP